MRPGPALGPMMRDACTLGALTRLAGLAARVNNQSVAEFEWHCAIQIHASYVSVSYHDDSRPGAARPSVADFEVTG